MTMNGLEIIEQSEIKDWIKKARITDDNEDDLPFKAAVILMTGLLHSTCSYSKIKRITGYWWKEVVFVIHNFWANGIIYDYHWNLNITDKDFENIIEFTLCVMAGVGEIVRVAEGIKPYEKPISWDKFLKKTEFCCGSNTAKKNINADDKIVQKRNNKLRKHFKENGFNKYRKIKPTTQEPVIKEATTLIINEPTTQVTKEKPYEFYNPYQFEKELQDKI